MNTQKTVVIWDDCDREEIGFFVVEGDKRHWHGKYEYVQNISYPSEFYDLAFDEGERRKATDEFPTTAVLEGAFVVVCGILP